VHDSQLGKLCYCRQQRSHVVLDPFGVELGQISQMWLTFLITEDEGDLALESIALYKISVVFLPIYQFQNEHFHQNEGRINCGENPLNRVLSTISILVSIVGVRPHRLENHSIRAYK